MTFHNDIQINVNALCAGERINLFNKIKWAYTSPKVSNYVDNTMDQTACTAEESAILTKMLR